MAGILPTNGVPCAATQNCEPDPILAEGCEPLWYAPRCTPRIDPFAQNALIAEVLNAINCDGEEYDCDRVDNLCATLTRMTSPCTLPILTLTPDLNGGYDDSYTAGCFKGIKGRVSIQSILNAVTTICELPQTSAIDLDDQIGMCVDGAEAKVPVSALIGLLPTPTIVPNWLDIGTIAMGAFTTNFMNPEQALPVREGLTFNAAAFPFWVTSWSGALNLGSSTRVNAGIWRVQGFVGETRGSDGDVRPLGLVQRIA